MTSKEKSIERWKRVKEERYAAVELVLVGNGFQRGSARGSHFVFRHRLIVKYCRMLPGYFLGVFAPDGSLLIVSHGNQVKEWYLRKAADALEKLREIEILEANLRKYAV